MHIPAAFAMSDDDVRALLARTGAGDLVTSTADGLLATMLPFVFDPAAGPHGALLGHLARANDQWRIPAIGESLVILRGPDAYVSPGWYPSKREHGRVVPTWDYVAVHVHGQLVVHDDVVWLEDVVRRLTQAHESARVEPWSVDDAPAAFVAGQLRAIVGVELRITRVDAKAKLSQNRPAADRAGVVEGYRLAGDTVMADAVERASRP